MSGSITVDPHFDTVRPEPQLKTRAIKGATLAITGQIASFIIQTTGTILLARLLAPHDFGLVAMVLAFSMLLQNLGCNGFVEAVVQRKEINHRQISTLFWINAGLGLLLALIFWACAPAIAWFYQNPELKPIVAVMGLSILFGGLSNQHVSLLVRNMRFLRTTGNEVTAAFTSTAIAIGMAWWGCGHWALVAKWLLAPLMITLGAWLLCDWRPGLPSRNAEVRPLLRYALHTYGNFIMTYFRRNADKMLVGRSFGSLQLGYYDRAYQLSNMLPTQIVSPLNSVSLATFSRLSSDAGGFRQNYLKVLSIFAFVGMPLSAALTLSSGDIILLLLGPQWAASEKIFRVFGPCIGVAILYITHGWLHLSLGRPDRWFRWSIVEFIVTALCFAAGYPFGAFGVAVGFSLSFYLLIGPALWYAGKPIHLRFSSVLFAVWRYFLSALVSGLLSWYFLYCFAPVAAMYGTLPILIRLAVAAALCISMYLGIITALFQGLQPIRQCAAILRDLIHKEPRD